MTVLLTGGAGFIGSFVAESYLKKGFKVIILDNFSTGRQDNIKSIIGNPNLIIYDIDIKYPSVKDIVKKHAPDIINHHAAQKSIPNSINNPLSDANENIIGLLNIITSCKESQIKNFVYISSGGALSSSNEVITEDTKPGFESSYAITKFAGENYVKLYSNLLNFSYSILRYGNVYGPRQTREGECGVIPIFIENIIANTASYLYTYEDMPFGCVRDYVYVGDVAKANILATKKPINDIVNISSGKGEYIKSIYDCIKIVFDKDIPLLIKGPRQNDVKYSVLSSKKAKSLLNWEATTSLEEGIKTIFETYTM